ncbi:hypothetical protein HYX07_05260 [Candidatus Woesearchaeota archaeon]|nr:hypothetical protein [Candidatus Woesearchaeota archaeon]
METKSVSFLSEWTVNFIKNKDIIAKKIESIENGKNGFDLYVKYRDREQYFIIAPIISNIDSIIQKIDNNAHYTIVMLNSRENFNAIVKDWHKLVSFKFLSIIFVNPFSELDKKWMVFPYTHHKVCDESSLEKGLRSMFEMVEPIEEGQLLVKITG